MKKLRFLTAAVFVMSVCVLSFAKGKPAADGTTASITILETSDIHGALTTWSYATDSAFDGGFAKAASVIKSEREKDPELLLLDCGDSMQDNLVQEFRFDKVPPVILAFNSLKYDAWQLGNHEFNFEFSSLSKAIKASKVPVLSSNIYKPNGKRWLTPYIVKEVKGVKVAVIGFAPQHITRWEASNPEHYNGMSFVEIGKELEKILPEVKAKSDVIVVLAHYGKEGEYGTEGMQEIAERYGKEIPVFLLGHAHETYATSLENGAAIIEPGSKCTAVGKVTLNLKKENGSWNVEQVVPEIIQIAKKNIEADPETVKLFEYVDTRSKQIANTTVGKVGADFLPSLWWKDIAGIPTAVVQDTAMIDLINKVQLEETKADVSLAALFTTTSDLKEGDFKKRDGVKIYKYDNTLMAVKVTGKQLKAIMEKQAGNFFNAPSEGDVSISFNPNIRLYNYDMFAGVNYEIDISKPLGSRIVNLTYKGEPLKDEEVLVLAMNNYRYGGLSSSGMISSKSEDLVYNTGFAIRDLIGEYVAKESQKNGKLMPECDNNWKITGINTDIPGAEEVYAKVRAGELKLPSSEDGRTPNVAPLNVKMLK